MTGTQVPVFLFAKKFQWPLLSMLLGEPGGSLAEVSTGRQIEYPARKRTVVTRNKRPVADTQPSPILKCVDMSAYFASAKVVL